MPNTETTNTKDTNAHVFTNDADIRRLLIVKAQRDQGDEWYDNYHERMKIMDQLHNSNMRM